MKKIVTININGKNYERYIDMRLSLAEFIREEAGLTGTKCGCNVGECGACTVLIDGKPFDSCIYLAIWAEGRAIRTVESLVGVDGELNLLQKTFLEEGAVQCGFCTPGFLMTSTSLIEKGEKLERKEIRRQLAGNMCRCTGYENIVNAVEKVMDS